MSEFNSEKGGIQYLHLKTDGLFGEHSVSKFKVYKFRGFSSVRSLEDTAEPIYTPVSYPTWIFKLDGTDAHANVAMKAYIESLRGVNDELVNDLLTQFPFLQTQND